MRRLALGGVLGPAIFTLAVVVSGALRPSYNHLTQFISELGATGTPHAALMNVGGFIPGGALIAVFGIATFWLVPRGIRSAIAGASITLFGISTLVAGLYSCDPGCVPGPRMSPAEGVHFLVSLAGFLVAIAGIGVWALEFRQHALLRGLWRYSALTAFLAFGFLVAFQVSLPTHAYTGLWQRLQIGTLFVWCAVVAIRLFGSRPVRAV